jgi:predicted DNA-binding protein
VTQTVRTTVRLPSTLQQQIESLARALGLTCTALIRRALEDYILRSDELPVPQNANADFASSISRIALTTEFTQATVDILLRDRAASDRDEVLLTVKQRMEKFHGKK